MVFETSFFFTTQLFDPADSPTEFYYTQSPGKQQILHVLMFAITFHRLINFNIRKIR